MKTKIALFADTVLRKDGDQLYLMSRQEGGFRSWAIPVESEEWLMDHYQVRVGEWSRDEHGLFCPVTRIPKEDPDERDFKFHDVGMRGMGAPVQPSMEHSVLAPYLRDGSTEREAFVVTDGYKDDHTKPYPEDQLGRNGSVVFGVGTPLLSGSRDPGAFATKVRMDSETRKLFEANLRERGLELVPYMVNGEVVRSDSKEEIQGRVEEGLTRAQALGRAFYEDGVLEDKCFQPDKVSPGLQQFIDAHPGVQVGVGLGPFFVALMPDGSAMAVDQDGTVVVEDEG
jgi:hypothetical protein